MTIRSITYNCDTEDHEKRSAQHNVRFFAVDSDGTLLYFEKDLCEECRNSVAESEANLNAHAQNARPINPSVVAGSNGNGSSRRNANPDLNMNDVRAWARENGYPDLKDKGRVPNEVTDDYRKAHSKAAVASSTTDNAEKGAAE